MCGDSNKSSVRRNRCGKGTGGLPCSRVFEQEYGLGDFKAILFNNSGKYKYHEIFDDFPRDKDNKNAFDLSYLDKSAQGLFEYVEWVIRKKEDENPDYCISNLKGFVSAAVFRFLGEYRRDLQNIHEATVDDDILGELRLLLSRPDLSESDLRPLTNSSMTSTERDLLGEIKNHPGYRNIWLKLKSEEGKSKLVMCFTEQDIVDKYNFVVSTNDPEDDDENPGILSLEDRYEGFYRILNQREKCVYKYRIKKKLPLREVVNQCWDKPVAPSNVNNVLKDIVKKVKKKFIGNTDG